MELTEKMVDDVLKAAVRELLEEAKGVEYPHSWWAGLPSIKKELFLAIIEAHDDMVKGE